MLYEDKPMAEKKQTVTLKDRHALTLDGITDVSGFDTGAVFLRTVFGDLTVEGAGLHITRLDLGRGEVALDGRIDALVYAEGGEKPKKGGFFPRAGKG